MDGRTMRTYIIERDLGPNYWLREPEKGESLENEKTIDLSDEDFEAWEKMLELYSEWQWKLNDAYKGRK